MCSLAKIDEWLSGDADRPVASMMVSRLACGVATKIMFAELR